MIFKTTTLPIHTSTEFQWIDITDQVSSWVKDENFENGLLIIASQHTTAAIKINESCDKLEKDLLDFWKQVAPTDGSYRHNQNPIDGRLNAHSHLLHYFLNTSETVTVVNQKLQLGSWQRIFFVELDGPREKREAQLTFTGIIATA